VRIGLWRRYFLISRKKGEEKKKRGTVTLIFKTSLLEGEDRSEDNKLI